ncbi:hypothetical protein ACVWYQ_002654 [Bradyrhizobium sp. USDA 3397]
MNVQLMIRSSMAPAPAFLLQETGKDINPAGSRFGATNLRFSNTVTSGNKEIILRR